MVFVIIFLLCLLLLLAQSSSIETFSNKEITFPYSQYNPLASFVAAVRLTETSKRSTTRFNVLLVFNRFVEGDVSDLEQSACDDSIVKSFIKHVEQNINGFVFFEGDYTCYTHRYIDAYFVKLHCTVINKNLQTSNELKQGDITKIPVDVYAALNKDEVFYTSVNGFKVESDIVRYANPKSKNYYYSAQMFNSNIDNPDMFGGYSLLTPDHETLKKYCKQRRDELNKYSYCKLKQKSSDGIVKDVYDQTVDEVNCVSKGGEIVRINTPKFGLLFDNLDAITVLSNGKVEINDMYIGESDICSDLSVEDDSDVNREFNINRKYNKVVTNYLK